MPKGEDYLIGRYICPVCKGTNLIYENGQWRCKDCNYFFLSDPKKVKKRNRIPPVMLAIIIISSLCLILGCTYLLLPGSTKAKLSGFFAKFGTSTVSKTSSSTSFTSKINTTSLPMAQFYVGNYFSGHTVTLKVLNDWTGSGNKTIDFAVSNPPVVINYNYKATSQLAADFRMTIQGVNMAPIGSIISQDAYNGLTLTGTGKYRLIIYGAGFFWDVKIGADQ